MQKMYTHLNKKLPRKNSITMETMFFNTNILKNIGVKKYQC